MAIVADQAWDKLPPDQLAAAGVVAVSMYVGQDTTGKNMYPSIVADYAAVNISTITNFEYGAAQAANGNGQGVTDARLGLSQATDCGMPSWAPVLFSVDAALSPAQVAPYFGGCGSVLGVRRVGDYGDYYIVSGLAHDGLVTYGWQTPAWSNGNVDVADIQLLQTVRQLGGGADVDLIVGDISHIAWKPGQANPNPDPTVWSDVEVSIAGRAPQLQAGSTGNWVQAMQALLNIYGGSLFLVVDGNFGAATTGRLQRFQAVHGLAADGICGPKTWGALLRSPLRCPQITAGDQGNWIEFMQAMLNVAGGTTALACDGNFGPATTTRLQEFQANHGLTADGICGPKTWGALLA